MINAPDKILISHKYFWFR